MRVRQPLFGALLVTGLAACSLIADIPESVRVKCGHPIHVRLLNALGSPAVADIALPLFMGAVDHLREIKETGGIRGCDLEYEFTDALYGNPGQAVAAYEKWKAEPDWDKVVAIFGVSTIDADTLAPKVADDRRVLISTAYNGTLAAPKATPRMKVDVPDDRFIPGVPPELPNEHESSFPRDVDSKGFPYVFFPMTDYSTAMRIAMYQVSATDPGARVGWVYCGNNDFCSNPIYAGKSYAKFRELKIGRDVQPELTDGAEEYGKLLGTYFAEEASIAVGHREYAPVRWLWSGNLTAGTYSLAAALASLEAKEDLPPVPPTIWAQAREIIKNTKIIANNYGFDESLVTSLCPTLPTGACSRIFGVMPTNAFGDGKGASEMRQIEALHDKWRARDVNEPYNDPAAFKNPRLPAPPPTRSVRYVQGYMNIKLLKMGLERLIDRGLTLNGENLKNALETFQAEDTGGLTEPLTFTPEDHRPQSTVSIYKLDYSRGEPGVLLNVSAKLRISLQNDWLGW